MFGRIRDPFKLQFANHFIIYQKRPFRGRFGTGRLHSELWDRGVKVSQFWHNIEIVSQLQVARSQNLVHMRHIICRICYAFTWQHLLRFFEKPRVVKILFLSQFQFVENFPWIKLVLKNSPFLSGISISDPPEIECEPKNSWFRWTGRQ